MKRFLIIISLVFYSLCFAQDDEETTKSWLRSLETIKNEELQIEAIKSYIKSDNFYLPDSLAYREKMESITTRLKHPCKILFYINRKNKWQQLSTKEELLKHISNETVNDIRIITEGSESLFGTRGNCGAVIIKVNKKFKEWKK